MSHKSMLALAAALMAFSVAAPAGLNEVPMITRPGAAAFQLRTEAGSPITARFPFEIGPPVPPSAMLGPVSVALPPVVWTVPGAPLNRIPAVAPPAVRTADIYRGVIPFVALQGLFEVMMKLINLVIKLAPIAIAALMFNLAAVFGWDLLVRLGAYALVAVGAMAIHMFVVYPLLVWIFGGMNPLTFANGIGNRSSHGFRASAAPYAAVRSVSRFIST